MVDCKSSNCEAWRYFLFYARRHSLFVKTLESRQPYVFYQQNQWNAWPERSPVLQFEMKILS